MKKIILLFIYSFLCFNFHSQEKIEIVDKTIKFKAFSGEKDFYYGFAKGDKIIFSFSEINNKPLKTIEISEYPNNSKFKDFKSSYINEKTITVLKTGIYKFTYNNSSPTGRICKINISRIPSVDSLKNFNSMVYEKEINDTNFYTVNEKYLKSSDTNIIELTNQSLKVHSATNLNGNKTYMNVQLPNNTISWSYYIGVNQEGINELNKATKEFSKKANTILSTMSGYGPLAALALGSNSFISQIQKGEDIDYWILDRNNINLFKSRNNFKYIKRGKVINVASRMSSPLNGDIHFCFSNDNAITGVTATLKVVAITVNKLWGTKPIKKFTITKRKVKYLIP